MCPKIDVMERECKNLEFGNDLNKAQLFTLSLSITSILGYMHGAVNVCKKITNCTV
jgi:hypothetical protein